MNECIVCRYRTENKVNLKSGLEVPICDGDGGCLVLDPNKKETNEQENSR